jgi:hypothetical protein
MLFNEIDVWIEDLSTMIIAVVTLIDPFHSGVA